MQQRIRVATRGSALARTQTDWVIGRLAAHHPGLRVETRVVKTLADRVQDVPLHGFRERGVFVKEIENALLCGDADVAVHSMKDLPSDLPEGLVIGAVPAREDPVDVLVIRDSGSEYPARPPLPPPTVGGAGGGVQAGIPLAPGAVVGSSSLRRSAQLLHHRPDLRFADLRGNVDTRLRKLDAGDYDAIVLAAAGLIRLGLAARISVRLPEETCLPAVCQGALAIQCRADDAATLALLAALEDPETRACVTAERALLAAMGGGCAVPVGALARMEGSSIRLHASVVSPDGRRLLRDSFIGSATDPAAIGRTLGERLLAAGADDILRETRG